jgi:alpha-ribazole phosphatase
MELYLIRHTTPDVPRGMTYGRSDVPLKATFPEEAEAVRGHFPIDEEIPIWTSPLLRCRRLAESLAAGPARPDERLREIDFGEWELKRWDGQDTSAILDSVIEERAPGGESYLEVQTRSMGLVREIVAGGAPRAALVTHAGVIRCIIADAIGLPLRKMFRVHIALGSVSRIDVLPAISRLVFLNR